MIEITLPLTTPSANVRERMHWRRQREEVSQWETLATWAVRVQQRGPIVKATTKRHVRIVSFRRQRCRDIANLIGGCKGLIDGMVRAGLLVDDSERWATFVYDQAVASASSSGKPCTVITITDHPPA